MLTRRHLLGSGLAALGLAAGPVRAQATNLSNGGLPLEWAPTVVPVSAGLPPGEIHVDPNSYSLYWTMPDNLAIRYKVGIGRPGLYHSGVFFVGARKEWPSWKPTPDMVEREPELYAAYAEDGMPGGPDNPLGARALYLFTPEGGDTFMRIHGTNAPQTIGVAVSNGCARLINEHVIDLYDRVPMNTTVYLYPKSSALPA